MKRYQCLLQLNGTVTETQQLSYVIVNKITLTSISNGDAKFSKNSNSSVIYAVVAAAAALKHSRCLVFTFVSVL